MTRFGDFRPLCDGQAPSYYLCNLYYRQIQNFNSALLTGLSSNSTLAPVGINPTCGIPRVGATIDGADSTGLTPSSSKSLGNIANIIVCGLSVFVVVWLIVRALRRRAAVGRTEIIILLTVYLLSLPLQLLTTGSFLEQGSTALVALTSIHAGVVAAFFWTLLANALVALQVVEDGTLSSLVPITIFNIFFFVATLYISLDTALQFNTVKAFAPDPTSPLSLNNIALFVLTSVWPLAATFLYFVLMTYIVLGILRERRPMSYFIFAGILFILSQLDFFLLSQVICNRTNAKVDGSFVATILETMAIVVLYFAWRSITEESWGDDYY